MRKLEIELPDETWKKVRTLNYLLGGDLDPDQLLLTIIDTGLGQAIMAELGMHETAPRIQVVNTQPVRAAEPQPAAGDRMDASGISAGLGDEDDEEPEPEPKPKQRRMKTTAKAKPRSVTDAELDADMQVDDPEHEAKTDAPSFADQMASSLSADDLFSHASGLPVPPSDDESGADDLPPSTRRRRPITGTKGRVSAATEAN